MTQALRWTVTGALAFLTVVACVAQERAPTGSVRETALEGDPSPDAQTAGSGACPCGARSGVAPSDCGKGPGPDCGCGKGAGRGPGPGARGAGSCRGEGVGRGTAAGMGPGCDMGPGPDGTGRGAALRACNIGGASLDVTTRQAVERALEDERRAESRYAAAVAKLGQVAPLSRIERAERRHSSAVEQLIAAQGGSVPNATVAPRGQQFGTAANARREGERLERENIALFSMASEQRHLPAFERCAGSN